MIQNTMKKILINALQLDEVRVAIIEDQWLYNLELEKKNKEQKKGNIYKAKVTRVEPSLNAIFINYGTNKHGFLPFREISEDYLKTNINSSVKDTIVEGSEIIVQISKEERKNKGAALTTFINLAGCYLVLIPNNPKIGGISRHIDGEARIELREKLNNINLPEGMGIIIRTAGMGKSIEELEWELNMLLSQFKAIKKIANDNKAPYLIFQESNIIIRSIRDYLYSNIHEIIIDEFNIFKFICKHLSIVRPEFINKIKFYNDSIPLFSKHKIENQIELAFKREIYLPSGGSVIIDTTEALVSIDINSAKANKCGDIETTAFQTNFEAINEIARQLRIRDLSGLIVVDFIDMEDINNQKIIEKNLKDILSKDKARIQISKISKLGLLEISRQRLRHCLLENNEIICDKCNGTGRTNNMEFLSCIILRAIEEESSSIDIIQINIELPVKMITYIFNRKKDILLDMERKLNIKIMIIANQYLSMSDYKIFKIRSNDKLHFSYTNDTKKIVKQKKPEYIIENTNKYKKKTIIEVISNINEDNISKISIFSSNKGLNYKNSLNYKNLLDLDIAFKTLWMFVANSKEFFDI